MSTLSKILEWLEARGAKVLSVVPLRPAENCMSNSAPPMGKIEVVEAEAKPNRLCIHGGAIHCRHGADDCCWCEIRNGRRN